MRTKTPPKQGWKRSNAHQDPTFVALLNAEDGGPTRDDYPEPAACPTRVYFVLDVEAAQVKVGLARNVPRRIRDLSKQRGRRLELLGTMAGGYDLERMYHRMFDAYRVEGREWYSSEIVADVLRALAVDGGGHEATLRLGTASADAQVGAAS